MCFIEAVRIYMHAVNLVFYSGGLGLTFIGSVNIGRIQQRFCYLAVHMTPRNINFVSLDGLMMQESNVAF